MNSPVLLDLPSFMDDRGQFSPIWGQGNPNQIGQIAKGGTILNDIRRSYLINNSQKGVIRGLHYHDNETKYFTIVRGAAKFVTMKGWFCDDDNFGWKDDDEPMIFSMTERKSQLLVVPPKHCNGWISLTDDCCLLTFSSSTFEQSIADDKRLDPNYFKQFFGDLWGVGAR